MHPNTCYLNLSGVRAAVVDGHVEMNADVALDQGQNSCVHDLHTVWDSIHSHHYHTQPQYKRVHISNTMTALPLTIVSTCAIYIV